MTNEIIIGEKMPEYVGGCLCNETTFIAKGQPSNPHLCSCTMCQKSSGAPTVAWVEFSFKSFQWSGKTKPAFYQSSEKTQRCFCQRCGSFLGALNEGCENISITIATLKNPNLIVPTEKHSYKESAPSWWHVNIISK
jgi:hypothetical protein